MSRFTRFFDRNGPGPGSSAIKPEIPPGQQTPSSNQAGQSQMPPPPRGGIRGWLQSWNVKPGPDAAKEVKNEKVASGPWIEKLPWFLPYIDDKMAETPEMRKWYRRMWNDPNVKSGVAGKIIQVAALDPQFIPADKRSTEDKEMAKFLEWNVMDRLKDGLSMLVWNLLSGGLTDGYSLLEKCFDVEQQGKYAGHIGLFDLKPKLVDDDLIPMVDPFRNVTAIMGLRYNAGKQFDPRHFVHYRHMPFYNSPTGWSDLRAAYSSYWILDTTLKLRAAGIEKRALPMLLGTYSNPSMKTSLDAALAMAKSANWMSAPEGCKVEAINLAMSSDTIFAKAIEDLSQRIFVAIQFASLQSLQAGSDVKQGNSQVHKSQSELLPWWLSTQLASLFNNRDGGLARDIIDLNFTVNEYPRIKFGAVDLNEQKVKLEIYTGLNKLIDLSEDQIREDFGANPPIDADDTIAKAVAGGMGATGGGGDPNDPFGGAGGGDQGNDAWEQDSSDDGTDNFAEYIDDARWTDTPQSSWVSAFRYCANDLTLDMEFKDGAICRYEEIEPRLAHNLRRVASKGKWVWREVYDWPYDLIQDARKHGEVAERFAEAFETFQTSDWVHSRGPHGGSVWTNQKSGKIVYGSTSPGGVGKEAASGLKPGAVDPKQAAADKEKQRAANKAKKDQVQRLRHPEKLDKKDSSDDLFNQNGGPPISELAKQIKPEERSSWHKIKSAAKTAAVGASTGILSLTAKHMEHIADVFKETVMGVSDDIFDKVGTLDPAGDMSGGFVSSQTAMKVAAWAISHAMVTMKAHLQRRGTHVSHAEDSEAVTADDVLKVIGPILEALDMKKLVPSRERVDEMLGELMHKRDKKATKHSERWAADDELVLRAAVILARSVA